MNFLKLFLSALLGLLLFSCDPEEENQLNVNTHRISEVYSRYGDEQQKYEFSYDGDKLIEILESFSSNGTLWDVVSKTELSYNGDEVVATSYENASGTWVYDDRSVYTLKNGRITEEKAFELDGSTWIEDWRWKYVYTNGNLSSWKSYSNNEGMMEQDGWGELFYEGGLLVEVKAYELDDMGSWYQDDRETFNYEDGKLVLWQDFDLDEDGTTYNDSKEEYFYANDKVSFIDAYDWNFDTDSWGLDDTHSYSYNETGYLAEDIELGGETQNYYYEEGNGNAQLFWYYPEEMIYGEPKLKRVKQSAKLHIPFYKRLKSINSLR